MPGGVGGGSRKASPYPDYDVLASNMAKNLLLLYAAKAPCSQNSNDFNGLVDYPSNIPYKFILN
jgi:hypothetical protein